MKFDQDKGEQMEIKVPILGVWREAKDALMQRIADVVVGRGAILQPFKKETCCEHFADRRPGAVTG